MSHEWKDDQASCNSRQDLLIENSHKPMGQNLSKLFLSSNGSMSKSSVKETIALAKEMGLELSSDGESWVPIDELVVQLHPDKHKQVRISENKREVNSSWLQLIF